LKKSAAKIPPRPRDREKTQALLLDAARALVADEGFQALGVNKLAARAGTDKQLVYRYFGGIDGVLDALAQDVAFWFGPVPEISERATYAQIAVHLFDAYAERLRASKMLRQAILWEMAERSPAALKLEAARSAQFRVWLAKLLRGRAAPPGVDAPAINAVLLAALHTLALRSDSSASFAGLPLASDADWQRVRATLQTLVKLAYGNA